MVDTKTAILKAHATSVNEPLYGVCTHCKPHCHLFDLTQAKCKHACPRALPTPKCQSLEDINYKHTDIVAPSQRWRVNRYVDVFGDGTMSEGRMAEGGGGSGEAEKGGLGCGEVGKCKNCVGQVPRQRRPATRHTVFNYTDHVDRVHGTAVYRSCR